MNLKLGRLDREFRRDVKLDTYLDTAIVYGGHLGYDRSVIASREHLLWGEDRDSTEHVYSDRLNTRNDARDHMAGQLASERFPSRTADWFEFYLSASLLYPVTLHSVFGGRNGRGYPYQRFGYERNNDPAAQEALHALIRSYAERAQIGYDILTAEVDPRSVRTVPTDYIEYGTGTDAAPSKTVEMIQQGPTEEWSPRRKFLAAIATILALPLDSKRG